MKPLSLALLASLAAAAAVAAAAPKFTVQDLGVPTGSTAAIATGINAAGTLCGTASADGSNTAFTFQNNQLTLLPNGGRAYAVAEDINDGGIVAGEVTEGLGMPETPVLWKQGQLSELPILTGGSFGFVYDMNNPGIVVGVADNAEHHQRAVLWQKGKIKDLGALAGDTDSRAYAVANNGDVAGTSFGDASPKIRLFKWSKGKMKELRQPAGLSFPVVVGINDQGEILATATKGGNIVLIRWRKDQPTLITAPAGFPAIFRAAMNQKGDIVVTANDANVQTHLLLLSGNKFSDLGAVPASILALQPTKLNNKRQLSAGIITDAGNHAALVKIK